LIRAEGGGFGEANQVSLDLGTNFFAPSMVFAIDAINGKTMASGLVAIGFEPKQTFVNCFSH